MTEHGAGRKWRQNAEKRQESEVFQSISHPMPIPCIEENEDEDEDKGVWDADCGTLYAVYMYPITFW